MKQQPLTVKVKGATVSFTVQLPENEKEFLQRTGQELLVVGNARFLKAVADSIRTRIGFKKLDPKDKKSVQKAVDSYKLDDGKVGLPRVHDRKVLKRSEFSDEQWRQIMKMRDEGKREAAASPATSPGT